MTVSLLIYVDGHQVHSLSWINGSNYFLLSFSPYSIYTYTGLFVFLLCQETYRLDNQWSVQMPNESLISICVFFSPYSLWSPNNLCIGGRCAQAATGKRHGSNCPSHYPMDEQIGFGSPYCPSILVLRLQYHRLSKKLGVLNEDGVYCKIRTRIRNKSFRIHNNGYQQSGQAVWNVHHS